MNPNHVYSEADVALVEGIVSRNCATLCCGWYGALLPQC